MFRNYLKITFRNLIKNKTYSLINILGLSVGLACAIIIYLWVQDELSIDKFHKNDENLFQIKVNHQTSSGILTGDGTPHLLASSLADEIPEIKYSTAVTRDKDLNFNLSFNDKNIKAYGEFADKNFFNIFSFDLLEGNKEQVFIDQNSIVISDESAAKLFGSSENVIGKRIVWELQNFTNEVIISGVFKKISHNSTMQFDFLIPREWIIKKSPSSSSWGNFGPKTYVVLRNGTNTSQFESKIKHFITSKSNDSTVTLFIQPYSDTYLYNNYENGIQAGGRIEYLYLFSGIGLIILIIACINFINLSTARATRRLKEVGIKKTIGVSRKHLIYQFIGESVLLATFSLLVSLFIVGIILPHISNITGKYLLLNFNSDFIFILLLSAFLTGVISGSYPAFYISGFNPVSILKGRYYTPGNEILIRKGLVVFQFIASIILIVSVFVVSKQVNFVHEKNLGYSKDQVIRFMISGEAAKKSEIFINRAKKIPGVKNASSVMHTLIGSNSQTWGVSWEGKDPNEQIWFEYTGVNYDLLETMGIEMKSGRTFSRNFATDTSAVIFNEAAVKVMGITEPIGKVINFWGKKTTIIGVTKNFHFESLHKNIRPFLFYLKPDQSFYAMIKVDKNSDHTTIEKIGELYKEFSPSSSFDYKFIDEDYQRQYKSEERIAGLSKYFAAIAIIISCLGIFGLVAFTAQKKQKEISIRKILGSSELGIIYLLSSDFGRVIVIANVIALPMSYILVNNWLRSFAYKIELSWWIFALSGILSLCIAFLTISWHAIKSAIANPINSLRNE